MKKPVTQNWKINHEIRSPEVRVLGEDGKQVGVMKISEAIAYAQKEGIDLVEIAPQATPPVVKAIEFGKFRYQEEKKAREVSKKNKGSELKEIRFTPFIGGADFDTRFRRIEEFLEDSNKVRVVVVFANKQLGAKQSGYDILKKLISGLQGRIVIDMEPKFFGRRLAMVISPYKKSKKLAEDLPKVEIDPKVISEEN